MSIASYHNSHQTLTSNMVKMKKKKKDLEKLKYNSDPDNYKGFLNSIVPSEHSGLNTSNAGIKLESNNFKKEKKSCFLENLDTTKKERKDRIKSLIEQDVGQIKDKIIEFQFKEKHNKGNSHVRKRTLLKSVDLDNYLGGRFSDKFTSKLKKDKNDKSINHPILSHESEWEEFLKHNMKDSMFIYDSLNLQSELKNSSCELPMLNSKQINLPSLNNLHSSNYNHNIHLKQKYLNHRKLFKNQDEIKRLYFVVRNVKQEVNSLMLKGHSNLNLQQKEKIKDGVLKLMNFRSNELKGK